ncbi:MAG: zf-HC2 domain-containing protein [Thermodesulfobacteriota bacterium]
MTTGERRPPCEVGPDDTRLLAYLEGALSDEEAHEIKVHLQVCPVCTKELELLQRMISLMESHSTAFHVDEATLYRFVAHREDPQGAVAQHLSACDDCRADVEALREMLKIDVGTAPVVGPIPESLRARLEAFQTEGKIHEEPAPWLSRLGDWMRELFGPMPTLAFGTAAALVILAVLLVPLWPKIQELTQETTGLREAQIEEKAPLADKKREESAPSEPAEQPQEYRYGVPPPVPEIELRAEKPGAPLPSPAQQPAAPRSGRGPYLGRQGPVSAGESAPTPEELEASRPARTQTGVPPVAKKMKRAETSRKGDIEPEKEVAPAETQHFRSKQLELFSFRLRVVDAQGRDIPWLTAKISGLARDELRDRAPIPDREIAEPQARRERDGAPAAEEWKEPPLMPAHEIVIRVEQVGEEYRIAGSLQDGRTGAVLKKLEHSNIPLNSLPDAVDSMVAALALYRGPDPSQK